MKISLEVSEETLFQLKQLNAKEGCPGRSDLDLLSDLIHNIVDLTYQTLLSEEKQAEVAKLKEAIECCYEEAENVRSRVLPFPDCSGIN